MLWAGRALLLPPAHRAANLPEVNPQVSHRQLKGSCLVLNEHVVLCAFDRILTMLAAPALGDGGTTGHNTRLSQPRPVELLQMWGA